jgi:guanine deaminase
MCLGAIYWARPRAVFFSATRDDAAAAGFDDAFVYDELALPPAARTLPMQRVELAEAAGPFAAWAARADRVEY